MAIFILRKVKKLKAWQLKSGYMSVTPYVDGKRYNKRVHQMVAEAWIPNPDGHPMINHINGIKNDNRVENLEWCSASHNCQHAWDNGLNHCTTSRKVVICETGQYFTSPRKMAEAMGWDNRWTSHITAVCRKNGKVKRKTIHGYTIRYYNPNPLVRKLIEAGFDKYPKEDEGDVYFSYLCLSQKWLREKKKMHCQVLLNGVRSMYFWQVRELVGNGKYTDSTRQYDVYEDAMADCISSALDLLAGKEGEK